MKTQPFSQTGQMIELCCDFLSVRCIWLYVIIMSLTGFRVNPHSLPQCLGTLCWKQVTYRGLSESSEIQTNNHLVRKWTLNRQNGQIIELCCEYLSVSCISLYVIILSRTSFRVNPHSVVCLNVTELVARSRCHIWGLSDSNHIRP